MIKFDETLVAILYLVGHNMDWMAGISVENEITVMNYRFRYYNPESTNVHDGKDRKSWYRIESVPGPGRSTPELVEHAVEMMMLLKEKGFCPPGSPDPYVLIRAGRPFEDFLEEFRKAPFVHQASPEEVSEHYPEGVPHA